jgi:hypothetical protein
MEERLSQRDLPVLRYNRASKTLGDTLRFRLHFTLDKIPGKLPNDLQSNTRKIHYLSAKQIPSACSIKHPGSPSVKFQETTLTGSGFILEETLLKVTDNGKLNIQSKTSLGGLTEENLGQKGTEVLQEYLSSYTPSESSDFDEDVPEPVIINQPEPEPEILRRHIRIQYEDPWEIFSARTWYESRGEDPPEIRLWFGDVLRIQDPLPRRVLGPDWNSQKNNKIRFSEISKWEVKYYILTQHTHWGSALMQYSRRATEDSDIREWSQLQLKRLKAFLTGNADPRWTANFAKKFHLPGVTPQRLKSRSSRLIEVLKTVDGMFCQRYLTFPQEIWTWEKYDMFILRNLFELISDEFLDGELPRDALAITTRYEELKAARGIFKMKSHRGDHPDTFEEDLNLPDWLHQLQPLWAETMRISNRYQRLARIGILSQTRGCGTPPPLVVLKTKNKFLEVVTEERPPLSPLQKRIAFASCQEVIESIPDEAFTGLSTKSRITVTSSACWEYTQKEGGTVQAISDLVALGKLDHPASIFDLETGLLQEQKTLGELQPGEYIFWRCLEIVLGKQRSETEAVSMVAIKEPGKSRIVTKGSAYVKILLDVVNKICSEPLKKGLETSSSGMGKSHHGWNFFQSFFKKDLEDILFSLDNQEKEVNEVVPNHIGLHNTYKAAYVSSTDFETATDYMNLEIASIVGNQWMYRCGIPKVLRAIVHQFCFRPRTVVFLGRGALSHLGTPFPGGDNLRQVKIVRGIMMGDPLTKVILHLVNAMVRSVSLNFDKIEFLRRVFPTTYHAVWEEIQTIIGNRK